MQFLKGLTGICISILQINGKKIDTHFLKWAKDANRHFTKKVSQMISKHKKRLSVSLVIREMYIKTTMKYCYTFIRMTKIKRTIPNVDKHVEQMELP